MLLPRARVRSRESQRLNGPNNNFPLQQSRPVGPIGISLPDVVVEAHVVVRKVVEEEEVEAEAREQVSLRHLPLKTSNDVSSQSVSIALSVHSSICSKVPCSTKE